MNLFTVYDLNETFILMSKFSMEACPQIGCLKKGKRHLVILCPKKTKSFKEI